jgi:hypothetical protein
MSGRGRDKMKALRIILLIFGWIIPIAVILGAGVNIYSQLAFSPIAEFSASQKMMRVISILAGNINNLALSPLCFFAAYILKNRAAS